jgi:SAM-dependent methyltransferase
MRTVSSRIRYAAARSYYRMAHLAGGADFFNEIEYWDHYLRGRPSFLFDPATRARAFPKKIREFLQERSEHAGRVRVLEVGSGPVSILCAGVYEGIIEVTAVDPLADVYRCMLEVLGIRFPVRPIRGQGEHLASLLAERLFDLCYSSNALDHSRSPRTCIEQMCGRVRPGGWIVLEGFEREGSHGGWDGLHQHDLFLDSGRLMHEGRTGRRMELTANLPLKPLSNRTCQFSEREIDSFGYELPPDLSEDSPGSWMRREWYEVAFQRI